MKKSFAGRLWLLEGGLFAFSLAGFVVQSEATIYTVNSTANGTNYSAGYDTSLNGFTSWAANGANQLALQSLYYSENGGAISLLTSPSSVTTNSFLNQGKLTVTYSISGGSVVDTMTVNGSSLLESIVFNNTSGTPLNMKIFQYSDFVLGGPAAAGSQTVGMTPSVDGGYAIANQSGGGLTLSWKGDAPGYTTLVQANSSGFPFGAFIGYGTDLDNSTLTANNTYAVFGYEFSGSVGAGNKLSISETSAFPVPEPSSVVLIASGMFALGLLRRRHGKV
ncbi:MAG: PEP-CTERM sorting domain-containing protein [Verrucomicrobiota bacterium]